jgi:hypothetical protein
VCIDWGNIVRFDRAVDGFSIANEAGALLGATWQTAIQAEQVYPFPIIINEEVNDEDTVNEDLPLGITKIREGKKDWTFSIQSNPYMDKLLQSHDGLKTGVYFVDNNGNKRGISKDGVTFDPIPVQLFQVQKPMENNGTDTSFKTMIKVVIADVRSYIDKAVIILADNMDFDAKEQKGLQPVALTVVGDPSATSLTVKATIAGTQTPVLGLDITASADFVIKTALGVEVVPSLITEDPSNNGEYTFTAVGLVTGDTVDLQAPTVMATEGYKSDGAQTLTVV